MNRALTSAPRGPEWEEWRCTKCGAPLCAVIAAPGMAIESLCRKCGQKEVRRVEMVDISQKKLDALRAEILAELAEIKRTFSPPDE